MAKAETDVDDPTGEADDREQSIEDLSDMEEQLGQMPIPGTGNQLTLNAGGEPPETATMKLQGGSLPVEGEFDKGTTIRLWVEGKVTKVEFVDTRDKNGFVIGTERRHVLSAVRVRRLEE